MKHYVLNVKSSRINFYTAPSIKAHFLICSTLPFISCFPKYVLNCLTDLKYIENVAEEQENARFQETLSLLIPYKVEYFFYC